jgi:cation transport ATPase
MQTYILTNCENGILVWSDRTIEKLRQTDEVLFDDG